MYTEIEINASPERVWTLLTDFARYPAWNPFIPYANGAAARGERIEVSLQSPGGAKATFRPTLLKVEPNRELRWLGHLFVPGVFDGEHIFVIEPSGPNRVRFIQREEFRGLLAPLLLPLIGKNTRRGFEAMNQALKAEAEKP
jgi:hypothetical protein